MSGYKQGNPDCWVLLHIDDLVSETDAPGIKNGTVTMSGEPLQIPLDASAVTTGMNNAWRMVFPFPPGFMNGSNSSMRIRMSWGSAPSGEWHVTLGCRSTAGTIGVASGMGYSSGTSALCINLASVDTTGSESGTPAQQGMILAPGDWSGLNSVGMVALSGAGTAGATYGEIGTGTGNYNVADQELCLCINSRNAGPVTESISVKVEYLCCV